ncbi:transmembrane epididymal protein 1A-like [Tachyglossus aculeatus]|uniref:transmembrane epididymal protein 1A-like n=1 Tax=Tachyglossus aculeatus TaxID=9261 RepID=UPI0018F32350|nr:transmembrane epididymal protein 1A-like [Tachyglossus aculeatus]
MGNFLGHLCPALSFLILGLFYAVRLSQALLKGQRFQSIPLVQRGRGAWGWLGRVPLDGAGKALCGTAILLGELFYPPGTNKLVLLDLGDPARPFLFPSEWQHVTMFGFFALSGWVDLVSWVWLARRQEGLERAALALAFHVLALLLLTHSQGKDPVENRVHFLLLLPAFLMALVLTLELWAPDQPQLWVAKTWLLLVQGSWLLQIAFMLYRPPTGQPWRGDNPADLMFLSTFFCWHLALDMGLLAAVYGLSGLRHRHGSPRAGEKGLGYRRCHLGPLDEELQKLEVEVGKMERGPIFGAGLLEI